MIDLRYGRDVLDALREIPDATVQCCVTSPPYYGLRDYKVAGQIGLEPTLDEFLSRLVAVFREVRRVLHPTGIAWVNMGDSYGQNQGGKVGTKPGTKCKPRDGMPSSWGAGLATPIDRKANGLREKSLLNVPYRLAFALADDGWLHRDTVIWHKPAPMPESVRDRCTKAWEPIFMFTRQPRYFADMEGVRMRAVSAPHAPKNRATADAGHLRNDIGTEAMGRVWGTTHSNLRNVWRMSSEPYKGAHFATFPSELPRRCLKIGTSPRGCCPTCRAPWVRVTERIAGKPNTALAVYQRARNDGATSGGVDNSTLGGSHGGRSTTGWKPICRCPASDPVPCLVLDPFSGSGTTMRVAAELGLDGIGIDLSDDYLHLARERVGSLYLQREETS